MLRLALSRSIKKLVIMVSVRVRLRCVSVPILAHGIAALFSDCLANMHQISRLVSSDKPHIRSGPDCNNSVHVRLSMSLSRCNAMVNFFPWLRLFISVYQSNRFVGGYVARLGKALKFMGERVIVQG